MKELPRFANSSATRVELQRDLDVAFAFGEISVEQWRTEFDRLSEPTRGCYREIGPICPI